MSGLPARPHWFPSPTVQCTFRVVARGDPSGSHCHTHHPPGWTLLLHKHEAEWRGQGLMVRDCWGSLTRIQGAPGLPTAVVGKNKDSIGFASIHLPPKATLDETETRLAQLGGTPALQQPRLVLGFDCNETFDFEGAEVRSCTPRGEAILVWAVHHELRLPLQQGTTPSYFPYNTSQLPRRLDYLWVRGLRTPWEGEVLQKTRTTMGSDQDAVAIFLPPLHPQGLCAWPTNRIFLCSARN